MAENKVSVREHGKGDTGSMTIEEFSNLITSEIKKQLLLN
jgi:threonyl-tRNA synthetase